MAFWINVFSMMLGISLFAGLLYWTKHLLNKFAPNLKYKIKYKLLRMKHKQKDIEMLMEDLDNNVDEKDLEKALLLSGRASPKKARELLYIFKEMKKVKGGEII